MLKAINNGM